MTIHIQFVFAFPCNIPNSVKSISPPEKVIPTPTPKICISIYESPASIQCTTYITGATKRKVNSIGSVIPVSIEVSAAESKSPPTSFLFSGRAVLYIAYAAAGRPKIINGNLPDINLVADTENCVVAFDASSAKKMFCAP